MLSQTQKKAGDLKGRLVRFGQSERFKRIFRKELEKGFGKTIQLDSEADLINFIDWFILEKKLSDGNTIADKFIQSSPYLSQKEKEMVLRWKDVTYGVFEVKEDLFDGYVLKNYLNDLEYLVKPNKEKSLLDLSKRDFFIARIVPIEDYHMFSGASIKIESKRPGREDLYQMISQMQNRFPYLVFKDNPQKIEKGYEITLNHYQAFWEHFGEDEIVISGKDLPKVMEGYFRYYIFERKDPDKGKTSAQVFKENYGFDPPLPTMDFQEDLLKASDVGILYDPMKGLIILIKYGAFKEIFSNPNFQKIKGYKELIMHYLKDNSISPLPFRRMVARFPQNAQKVLQDVLGIPYFTIEKDFEKLMRKYKSRHMEKKSFPPVIPVSDEIALSTIRSRANKVIPLSSKGSKP